MKKKSTLAHLKLWLGLRALRANRAFNDLLPVACQELFFFGGMAAIVYGSWMVYHPAGPFIGGAMAMWIATAISAERK